MEVISTTALSRSGDDVYTGDEEVLLVEQFGIYAVLRFYKSGWTSLVEAEVLIATSDKAEAGRKYKEYCKFYKS